MENSDVSNGYSIVPIPHLARGGRWRVEAMRSYDHPRIIWFTRGQGRITISGVTRGYGANNAIFLPAGTMHGFELNSQVFGSVIDLPKTYGGRLPETPLHLRIRDSVNQAEFNAHLEAFQRELLGNRLHRLSALDAHAALMIIWFERQEEIGARDNAPSDAAHRLANRFAEMVERDFSAARSVSDYASDLGITATHLSRVCNSANGRSAHDLLNERVLAEAHRLLADTKRPIREIAAELGFSSAAYFTRAFQKKTGITPSHFRGMA